MRGGQQYRVVTWVKEFGANTQRNESESERGMNARDGMGGSRG